LRRAGGSGTLRVRRPHARNRFPGSAAMAPAPREKFPSDTRGSHRALRRRRPMRMDKQTRRILVSGAFALALYLSIGERIEFMALPVMGFVWTLFALHATALSTGGRASYLDAPQSAHLRWMIFDIGVLAALFLSAWYWTAFAYAGSCGCAQLISARTAGKS
jgi:hypothetical protein